MSSIESPINSVVKSKEKFYQTRDEFLLLPTRMHQNSRWFDDEIAGLRFGDYDTPNVLEEVQYGTALSETG